MKVDTATFGMVAGVVSLAAFIPYIISILRGKTRPNRASWWIWTVVGIMLASSYSASGAKDTIWVAISYIIGPLITALLAIKFGEGGWTRFDRACIACAVMSGVLWFVFDSPMVALSINIVIDAAGALPTIKKTYKEPEGEDRVAWALFFIGNTINLFAVGTWNFAIAIYPIYLFIGSGIIAFQVFFRPRGKKPASSD